MPVRNAPNTDLEYLLACYNADGVERQDDPDGLISDLALERLADEPAPVTDVFIMSHGWQGDIPAAISQYDRWLLAMMSCREDVARARTRRPGFRPLIVGLHWPSRPWGDEDLAGGGFAAGAGAAGSFVDNAAGAIADTPAARAALAVILAAAEQDIEPDTMPPEVVAAYRTLDSEAGLSSEGVAADPGSDREPFDPEAAYEEARELELDFAGFSFGGLLAPLSQLSFWKMKDRGRKFGERGAHDLVRAMQEKAAGRDVRFHAMGHSFGCIVVSGMIAGPAGGAPLPRPLDAVGLVQGAMSLWSYCSDIPAAPGKPGYFSRVLNDGRVRGPIVTTRSQFDSAVGRLYPYAAGIKGQVAFGTDELPKYGGIGTFGLRGPGLTLIDSPMLSAKAAYDFAPGTIYNLKSDEFINEGGGFSGAHSDIANEEVAHAFWSAVLT